MATFERTRFLLISCIAASAAISGCCGANREMLGRNDVKAYLKSAYANSLDFLEVRRSQQFRHICDHLDEYLRDPEVGRCYELSYAVWHAAFLFGTRDQVAVAFDLCWSEVDTGFGTGIPYDLATANAFTLMRWLLYVSPVADSSLDRFLLELCNKSPDSWGVRDYTYALEQVMRSKRPVDTRSLAAYILAKWRRSTDVGEEAYQFLREAAEQDEIYAGTLFYRLHSENTTPAEGSDEP